ncbi:transcription factor bHLH100 [Iris pallida]|uniref:Protein IRON-RELATED TRANSCRIPTION FACTOR 2 n=1 Tax=Iris pallida TaxID=29817 RepID=A0AAX6GBA3_IRIPA|nr:transcription factor bHLH100 [Iris pallida]
MFALSPNIFPSSIGWPLEDSMIDEFHQDEYLFASYTPKEFDTSFNSITSSPDQMQEYEYRTVDLRNSATPETNHQMSSTKKSSHNEYERHRRKKLNSLYSSLRNLLPETDRSKNMSIPCTIGRVLKYIPELQRQIERLTRRKEDVLLRSSKESALASNNENKFVSYPTVSATCINRREVMVQICMVGKSAAVSIAKIVRVMEGEGLQLMSISTQTSLADKTICSLHLQAKEDVRMESQSFCEQLVSNLKG